MIHTAILRAAALLVPHNHRAEWLDEWVAELAYILHESPRRATRFCLGAFRDALWVRRSIPGQETRSRLLDSPMRCLLSLTAIAALTIGIAWRVPVTRAILQPNSERLVLISRPSGRFTSDQVRWLEQHLPAEFSPELLIDHGQVLAHRKLMIAHPELHWRIDIPAADGSRVTFNCTPFELGRPFLVMLWLASMSLPILIGTNSLSLGHYPARFSAHLRLWAFFTVKIALMVAILFFGILALGSATAVEIRPHGLVLGFALAIRWALKDQRRRCPVCLHRLTNPIHFGQAAHTFLDWYGTELICAEGHGMMHVPEIPTSCYPEPRWVSLDA